MPAEVAGAAALLLLVAVPGAGGSTARWRDEERGKREKVRRGAREDRHRLLQIVRRPVLLGANAEVGMQTPTPPYQAHHVQHQWLMSGSPLLGHLPVAGCWGQGCRANLAEVWH